MILSPQILVSLDGPREWGGNLFPSSSSAGDSVRKIPQKKALRVSPV